MQEIDQHEVSSVNAETYSLGSSGGTSLRCAAGYLKEDQQSQWKLAHRVLPAVKDADHVDQKPAHDNSHAKSHYRAPNDVPIAFLRRLGIQYAADHEGRADGD